jgi:hypothetical protein
MESIASLKISMFRVLRAGHAFSPSLARAPVSICACKASVISSEIPRSPCTFPSPSASIYLGVYNSRIPKPLRKMVAPSCAPATSMPGTGSRSPAVDANTVRVHTGPSGKSNDLPAITETLLTAQISEGGRSMDEKMALLAPSFRHMPYAIRVCRTRDNRAHFASPSFLERASHRHCTLCCL